MCQRAILRKHTVMVTATAKAPNATRADAVHAHIPNGHWGWRL
jgi:hypothetical protein